jgi:hypothetical protein
MKTKKQNQYEAQLRVTYHNTGNYRLQIYGEEKAKGLTGMQPWRQPAARPPFNSNQNPSQHNFRPVTGSSGSEITPNDLDSDS